MRRQESALIAVVAGVATAVALMAGVAAGGKQKKATKPAPPPCADTTACLAACDPQKSPASCTRLGEMQAAGLYAAADPSAAPAAWEQGCTGGDPRACVLLAT